MGCTLERTLRSNSLTPPGKGCLSYQISTPLTHSTKPKMIELTLGIQIHHELMNPDLELLYN